jgi:superfamily I DNA/RNA helicase
MQRGACLANNSVHRSLGCQGVARDRDMESVGERLYVAMTRAKEHLYLVQPIKFFRTQQHRSTAGFSESAHSSQFTQPSGICAVVVTGGPQFF